MKINHNTDIVRLVLIVCFAPRFISKKEGSRLVKCKSFQGPLKVYEIQVLEECFIRTHVILKVVF